MNRLEILIIVTNPEFNNCVADMDITKAWGNYIYATGEAISREEFISGGHSTQVINRDTLIYS